MQVIWPATGGPRKLGTSPHPQRVGSLATPGVPTEDDTAHKDPQLEDKRPELTPRSNAHSRSSPVQETGPVIRVCAQWVNSN